MRRVAFLAFLAACVTSSAAPDASHLDADHRDAEHVDAHRDIDAPHDAAGSADDQVSFQASPRDRGLDTSVLAFGFAIVLVPIPRARRRRAAQAPDVSPLL